MDVHRRARKWIVQKIVFGTKWADWDQEDVQLDENGYPLYLQVKITYNIVIRSHLNRSSGVL